MFTGIVTHRGVLTAVRPAQDAEDATELTVRPTPEFEAPCIGESIALDGVCLTVTQAREDTVTFQAVPETLRKTTLGDRQPGDTVNMERALRMGDALGGHWVQGHVDGVGVLVSRQTEGEDVRLVVRVPASMREGFLPKGSVTLDGVSLTVGEVWREGGHTRFSVYLIPHTLAATGLGALQPGDRVNIEADVLGRWVEHHVAQILNKNDRSTADGK